MHPTIAVLLFFAFLPACGVLKEEEKKKPAPRPTAPPITQPQLAPEYATPCHSETPTNSQIDRLRSNGKRALQTTETYDGAICAEGKLLSRLEITSSYKMGNAKADKIYRIDFHEESVKFTPVSAEVASEWNNKSFCEHTDWEANKAIAIDKHTGCMGANNTANQRILYTVIRLDGARLQLGKETSAADDGSLPERRHNSLKPHIYTRTAATGPLPDPDNTCPVLIGNFACTKGDNLFADKNAIVSTITSGRTSPLIRIELSQGGIPLTPPEEYQPGQPERTLTAGGIVIVTHDYCEQGQLRSNLLTYSEGDIHNKKIVKRSFVLDPRKFIVIFTKTINVVNDRPDHTENMRTECVRIN